MLEVLVGQVMDNTLSTLLTMPKDWVYDTLKQIDNHTEEH